MLNNKNTGFTLVEILIAMAIFSIIAILSTAALQTVIKQYHQTKYTQNKLLETQRAILKMTQDALQLVHRVSQNEFGDDLHGITLDKQNSGITLLIGGRTNWRDLARSNMQFVHYHLVGETLVRSYWRVLNQPKDSEAIDVEWLDEVESFKVSLLDEKNKSTLELTKAKFIVFDLKVNGLETITRIVPLPDYHQ